MIKVITELFVRNNGSVALNAFERDMEAAGRAADKTTGGVDRFTAAMREFEEAQRKGLAISDAGISRRSKEQILYERTASAIDKTLGLQIKLQRDAERTAVTMSNAVARGYLTQEQALEVLMKQEREHIVLLQQQAAASRMGGGGYGGGLDDSTRRMARQNLLYQGSDIAVSVAGGMPLHMVALQQGSQLISGPGGINAVLREAGNLALMAVKRFGFIGVAIGAVTGILAGLTSEFNKNGETQVSMLDVVLAGWQMFADGVMSIVSPIWDGITSGIQWVWDQTAPILKGIGNTIIGTFVGSFDAALAVWEGFPSALGDLVYQGAESAVNGVIYMIREVQIGVRGFLGWVDEQLRKIGGGLDLSGHKLMEYVDLGNPYAGQAGAMGSAVSDAFGAGMSKDYLGDFGAAWDARAEAIARARQETDALSSATGAAVDKQGDLAKAAQAAQDQMMQIYDFGKSTFTGLFTDIGKAIREGTDVWLAFGNSAISALDKIANKAIEMAANGLWAPLEIGEAA